MFFDDRNDAEINESSDSQHAQRREDYRSRTPDAARRHLRKIKKVVSSYGGVHQRRNKRWAW